MMLAAAGLPGMLRGAGFYLPNQDALATAKGNAWVATADSVAAVFYNPAGLTQLESPQAQVGTYVVNLGNEVNPPGGGTYHSKSQWQAVPHLYYAQPLNDGWSAGFGLNSPFGLGGEWGQFSPFRTVITEAQLTYLSATGVLAWRLNEQLSLGASMSLNYSELFLEQGLGFFPGDYLNFEGDGYAVSGGLSLMWRPADKHSFGLVWASGTSPELSGEVNSNLLASGDANMEFVTPQRAAAGYSYRPAPGWNLEFNVEWNDWDSLDELRVRGATLPGGVIPISFNWESMFIYEVGISYATESGYVFALGYDYNSNAVPDSTYNPVVADADLQWLNFGIGRTCGDWSWFLAGQLGYANRTVSGAPTTAAGESANGKYKSRHQTVMFSLRRRF